MAMLSNNWQLTLCPFVPYLEWTEDDVGEYVVWEVPGHSHATYEFHIILEGKASIFVENEAVELGEGQGIVISSHVFHEINSKGREVRRLSARFVLDKNFENKLCGNQMPKYNVFSLSASMQETCYEITREYEHSEALLHNEMLCSMFAQLMVELIRHMKLNTLQEFQENRKLNPREEMREIDVFFTMTPREFRTKEKLAEILHCSERQLIRKLYKYYGVSFQGKNVLGRIESAKHLLRSTNHSIGEISELLGYSDNAAFFRAFKKHVGITPGEYRKSLK